MTRRLPRAVAAAALVAPALALAEAVAATTAPETDAAHVVVSGHVDVGPRIMDGRWTVQIRDDSAGDEVWRSPSLTVLQVRDDTREQIPDAPEYAFLGAAGGDVWLLPQVEEPGAVWPGWNTQDPSVASTLDGAVSWALHGVDGPGSFALFVTGEFGEPQVLFDGDAPYPQRIEVAPDTHAHGNWAFSSPGTYLIDTDMSATVDGAEVTDRVTLRVHVGDPVPAQVRAPLTSASPSRGGQPEDGDVGLPVLGVTAGAVVLAIGALAILRHRYKARRSRPARADQRGSDDD